MVNNPIQTVKSEFWWQIRGLLEMTFCSIKLQGEDWKKDLPRYKQSLGGAGAKQCLRQNLQALKNKSNIFKFTD